MTNKYNNAVKDLDDPQEKKGQDKKVPPAKLWGGILSLLAWIAIFGAGLLIETDVWRHTLAPHSVPINDPAKKAVFGIGSVVVTAEIPSSQLRNSSLSYLSALICFTPLNLFFLATMAGLTGGYASNIAISTMSDEHRATLAKDNPRRDFLLQEPPISAAIRGFVVYLFVIAGLYVVFDSPFKDPSSSQYIRLAGTISIMAFLVGYDASRIEDWLNAIPGPRPPNEEEEKKPTEKITATSLNGTPSETSKVTGPAT